METEAWAGGGTSLHCGKRGGVCERLTRGQIPLSSRQLMPSQNEEPRAVSLCDDTRAADQDLYVKCLNA